MGKAKTAIIIVVLAALIGGYYFYLSKGQCSTGCDFKGSG